MPPGEEQPDYKRNSGAESPSSSKIDASSRREFLQRVAAAGAFARFGPGMLQAAPVEDARVPGSTQGNPELMQLTLRVNRKSRPLLVEPRTTLLDALNHRLGLTGTKKGCDHGQCGACTVLIDGRRIKSCLTLAVMHDQSEIVTVEGLGTDGALHPLQEAFLKHDAYQCGYCTPGQLCSAVACLAEGHAHTDEQIREWMSGNLCRCGAYPNIVAAIREVSASAASEPPH